MRKQGLGLVLVYDFEYWMRLAAWTPYIADDSMDQPTYAMALTDKIAPNSVINERDLSCPNHRRWHPRRCKSPVHHGSVLRFSEMCAARHHLADMAILQEGAHHTPYESPES